METDKIRISLVWDYVNEMYRAYPYDTVTNFAVGGSYTVTTSDAKKLVKQGRAYYVS
jgi:hypothetical protein